MSQSDQLNLSEHILTFLQNKFNSKPINNQLVQNLWQGYGEILKLQLENGESVILKSIVPANHDYESNSLRKFKMDSYQVEENFYKFMNEFMFVEGEKARIPKYFGSADFQNTSKNMLFCLEDLDKVGYTKRYKNRCNFNLDQAKICITWLAEFHAKFMNSKQSISDLVTQNKIWSWGTYWNLDQRLDLLQKLALSQENSLTEAATNLEVDLKNKARKLHEKLQNAKFKTIIHGDAKVENFCFYHDMTKVAGVDFQYVGTGIGVTDFWYFLTSCLENIETKHAKLLDFYFSELRKNLTTWSAENLDQMEAEWRELYPFCIADFERFVRANWPGHWKLTDFTFQTCQKALDQL